MVIEPDAEGVQSHPPRQARAQTLKLMRPLLPEPEGVEQLIVDALYNLADCGYPPPQAFGPASLAGVAFGWVDDICSVTFEPSSVVFGAFEALVGYVRPASSRAHADEPLVRSGSHSEEALSHLLVGGGSGTEAKARYDPARVNGTQQAK